MASSGVEELENSLKELCVSEVKKEESPILVKLQDFECPFTWTIDFVMDGLPVIDRMKEKLLEMIDEDEEYEPWKKFVLNMVLCWEHAKIKKFNKAVENLEQCERIIEAPRSSPTVLVMGDGLKHIALATKCFLFYLDESVDNNVIDTVLSEITPVDRLSKNDASSVYCMKGAIYSEYGFSGIKESIKFIEKGVSLEDNCSHWHYLLGRSLGRLRRIQNRGCVPEKRELDALEKAAALSDCPSFYILLSQSYREAARSLIFAKKGKKMQSLKPMLDTLNKKSLDLIRKVSSLDKNHPSTNIKCALGLMKLPNPWKDLELAECCILKALSAAPNNPMGNHVAGTYFSSVNQVEKALEYYKKAMELGVYGAEIDAMKLKRTCDKSYDILPDLMRIYEKYHEKPRRVSTLLYLGLYYYHVKHDFKNAFVYWSQIVDIDIHSHVLKMQHHFIFKSKYSVNEILLMESFKLIKSSNITSEEREKYFSIINKYIDDFPDVVEEVKSRQFGGVSKVTSIADAGDPDPHARVTSVSSRLTDHRDARNGTRRGAYKDHGSSSAAGPRSHVTDNRDHRDGNDASRGKYRAPRGSNNASRGRYDSARGSNKTPTGNNETPRDSNETSTGNDETPRGKYRTPRGSNNASRGGYDSAKGSNETPRGKYRTPRGSNNASRGGYDSARGCNETPRGKYMTPRGSNNVSRGRYDSARGSNETRTGNNETPRDSNETSRSNNGTPRGKYRTPKGSNNAPRGRYDSARGSNKSPTSSNETSSGNNSTPRDSNDAARHSDRIPEAAPKSPGAVAMHPGEAT